MDLALFEALDADRTIVRRLLQAVMILTSCAVPLLVISDGAPGLIGAVERTMGAALRQRCLVHSRDPAEPGNHPTPATSQTDRP